MNRIKTSRHIANVASLLWLPSILACSSAGPSDDKSNPESETPHAVLFEAKWSDTGRFQVLNDESGHLGMAVIGTIGKDDPRAVDKLVERSFVDTYRNLLPNESVPPLLAALEARRLAVPASTDRAPVVKLGSTDTVLPAEQVSRQQPNGPDICADFRLFRCSMHECTGCFYNIGDSNFVEAINNICPAHSDASFFSNTMINSNGSHALSGVSGSGFVAPANSWGWHYWWNGYPCAKPHMWNSVGGNMGVTTHVYVPQPCLQGEISE